MDHAHPYDADFYAWTQEQAAALRREAAVRSNAPLDFEHLAEEIESLGRRDVQALRSNLARIIEHLLKLEYSPDPYPRRGWGNSVRAHRRAVARLLKDSPSLRQRLAALVGEAYPDAAEAAAGGLGTLAEDFPETCPYDIDGVVDEAWWPANRFDPALTDPRLA